MNTLSSVANVGAGVSRFQALGETSRMTEQPETPGRRNAISAVAQLLQSALAKPDAGHDLDVVA